MEGVGSARWQQWIGLVMIPQHETPSYTLFTPCIPLCTLCVHLVYTLNRICVPFVYTLHSVLCTVSVCVFIF